MSAADQRNAWASDQDGKKKNKMRKKRIDLDPSGRTRGLSLRKGKTVVLDLILAPKGPPPSGSISAPSTLQQIIKAFTCTFFVPVSRLIMGGGGATKIARQMRGSRGTTRQLECAKQAADSQKNRQSAEEALSSKQAAYVTAPTAKWSSPAPDSLSSTSCSISLLELQVMLQ